MRLRLAAIAACSLVAACAVGPDYRRPDVEAPAAYPHAQPDAAAADTQWWKAYGDPVLDQLIADALANNKDVRIAAANVEQAAGLLRTTRSPLFPQVGYDAGGARRRISDEQQAALPSGTPDTQSSYQALATATWEIDLWGRIRRLTEAARANLLATEQARRGVVLSLVSTVANTYLQLRAFDEQLVIARRTADSYGQAVKLFELQFRYGVVSDMTVAQARSQYEFANAQIPQIEQQIVVTENALSILLGRNPGPIDRGRAINDFTPPAVPEGLPSDLLERRPDVAQAEQRLVAANARIGAARALYFPTISLTGAFGVTSPDLSNLFEGDSRIWNYGGSITGPIFTGGGVAGQVAQANAGQKAALEAYQAAIQNAFADVDNALSSRDKLAAELEARQRLLEASRTYERLAKLQYDGGYTSYLTVLDAQQRLFPAELSFAQTRAALLSASSNIYKAMGGGWITEADKLAPQPEPAGFFMPAVGAGAATVK